MKVSVTRQTLIYNQTGVSQPGFPPPPSGFSAGLPQPLSFEGSQAVFTELDSKWIGYDDNQFSLNNGGLISYLTPGQNPNTSQHTATLESRTVPTPKLNLKSTNKPILPKAANEVQKAFDNAVLQTVNPWFIGGT